MSDTNQDLRVHHGMLSDASVRSSQLHISVLMTGKFSNGQEIKGSSTNPIEPGAVELISYQLHTSRVLDKLTAKSSTPIMDGVYLMIEQSNPCVIYFQQAANSSITATLKLIFSKNDDGTKPVKYGTDILTDCRVGTIIVTPYSPVGPCVFIALHPSKVENTIGAATQSYDYIKGSAA